MKLLSVKILARARRALAVLSLVAVYLGVASCASAPQQPIGVATLPGVIQVSEWPYWLDIPIEETGVERIWKTTIDVVGERAAIAVMDRESGYLRTEWKSSPIIYSGMPSEERYTLRLQPEQGKIRLGLEVRVAVTSSYPSQIINTVQAPWTAIYRELQQRLVRM